jgi:hypothetical protein
LLSNGARTLALGIVDSFGEVVDQLVFKVAMVLLLGLKVL